jgi:beta-mannosidase
MLSNYKIDGTTDYALAESMRLELDYDDENGDYRKTNFPARHIYERVLPEAVSRLSNIHYHRSSPYSGFGKRSSDQRYGDIHQCKSSLASH